ncbi:MAG: hypothetical protein A2W80_11390 [Candidatus Riflebacteria bacterium GWC2_50_8]|nr:MAG: hypothetical protein A2W80_11390 [Candidatus Riflebacteria bacterium GWC2_50_8]
MIEAMPVGAADPIIYSNWKLATNTFEIGSTALANVKILSYNDPMLSLEITGTTVLTTNSIITGLFNNQPISVKLLPPFGLPGSSPPPPIGGGAQVFNVTVSSVAIEEVFEECKYLFRGKMSQLPAMSENLLSPSDPMYQSKVTYLRGGLRPSLRAGLTSPITADPSYGALSLEIENFELDPDVVVDFSTSFGIITQFEMRVDGYASCEIYAKFLASAGVELPAIEGTLLPHQEIPFFVGPVPGTWGREVTASWKFSLNAEAEVKAGTKMRVDFRSGVNYYRESGWNGQLLWRIKNTPIFEAKLKGTFTNEAAIEMKNSLKVGGLAGPELTLKPYIKSEATVSTEKPCQVDAALSMGMQGELKAIVQAWSYNIGEWGSTFEPFGPLVIASQTISANATPTLKITGASNLENKLSIIWPTSQDIVYHPHVFTSTGTDSIAIFMDDSKGLYKGLSKVEVSFDGNPAFLSFSLASDTTETGIPITPFPLQATLTLSLPLTMDENMLTVSDERFKWYTPFRLPPGAHEIMFKVYDKCGEHSIATHAVWVEAEEEIWKVQNDVGSISWEVGINGFEKGSLPELTRKIEPVEGGLDISPLKDGVVKHYDNSGTLLLEGAFSNNVRSGIWKILQDDIIISTYKSFVYQIEFADGGQPVSWLHLVDYVSDSTTDYRGRIQKTPSGAVQFSTISTDTSYIYQNINRSSFETGIRTIGFEAATCTYDIETFVGGLRNGSATHNLFSAYESTVQTWNGEYIDNLKTGAWVRKGFKNLTEFVSRTEGEVADDQPTGLWTHTDIAGVTSANYTNGVAQGGFGISWLNGNHVSGSYPVTGSERWPIMNSANQQVGTFTPQLTPITMSWPYKSPEAGDNW